MTTLTAARVAELPRVNLLPPEIAAASRLKRLQVLLGLAVVAVLAIASLLFMWASSQVGTANDELVTAQAEGAKLQTEVDEFAEVPKVLGEVQTAQAGLVTAMAPEIRFSFLLNDLSLTIPKSSRIASLDATNTAAAAQIVGAVPDATTTTTPETATAGIEPTDMGLVTFTSKTNSFDAVASWLQSLARQQGYANPTLQGVVKDEGQTVGTVYTVTSSTTLSPAAASKRFEQVLESE